MHRKRERRFSRDRVKGDILAQVKEFIETNMESIQEDYDALEPKERVLFLLKLLEFAIPKAQGDEKQATEINLLRQTIRNCG